MTVGQVAPQRMSYLDGLRGLAAMQVLLFHYLGALAPAWLAATGGVIDGSFAVFIFFIMSGFVLTPAFERTPDAVVAGLAGRVIRLGVPTAAACASAYLLRSLWPGEPTLAYTLAGTYDTIKFLPVTLPNALADASGLALVTGYSNTTLFGFLAPVLLPQFASVDAPIWTLHLELWGSVLVLILVFFKAWRIQTYSMVLLLCAICIGINALNLFVIGSLLSAASRTEWFNGRRARRIRPFAGASLLVIGYWLWFHPLEVPGFAQLAGVASHFMLVRPFYWYEPNLAAAALCIFVAIMLLPSLHGLLNCRPVQWLGRMSFPIYLLHVPILMTVSASAFAASFRFGQGAAALIAVLIGLSMTFAASAIFEKWVDKPAISASRRFRERITRGRALEKVEEAGRISVSAIRHLNNAPHPKLL